MRTVHIHALPHPQLDRAAADPGAPDAERKAYFPSLNKFVSTPVYDRRGLSAGQSFAGPAIVEQADTTLVVYPGQRARMEAGGNIVIEVNAHAA